MSGVSPPPPQRPGTAGGGPHADKMHPTSLFDMRPTGGPRAPVPVTSAKSATPAVRRADMLNAYTQYTNPMNTADAAAPPSSSSQLPPPSPLPSSAAKPDEGMPLYASNNGFSGLGSTPAAAIEQPPPPPRPFSATAAGTSAASSPRGYPAPGQGSSIRPLTLANVSSQSQPLTPKQAFPKMAALSSPATGAPAAAPPPPPPQIKATNRHAPGHAATGPRYAVPDFAYYETPESAQAKNTKQKSTQQQQQQRFPRGSEGIDALLPPPSIGVTAPPTATRAAQPHSPTTQTPPTIHSSPIMHSNTHPFNDAPYPSKVLPPPPPMCPTSSSIPPAPSSTTTGPPPPPPPQPAPIEPPLPLPSTANVAAAPPLTTRVSGAVLRNAISSRASSTGGGSRSSSHHSQQGRRGSLNAAEGALPATQKSASSLFVFPAERPELASAQGAETPTKPPTIPGYISNTNCKTITNNNNGSHLGSRSNSLNAHAASTTAMAAGSRRTSTMAGRSPNNTAAAAATLHRGVPSFLKPSTSCGPGVSVDVSSGLLTLRRGRATAGGAAATVEADKTHATISRGRELLEAALKSRGNRTSHPRSSGAVQPAVAAESSLNSVQNNKKGERDSVSTLAPPQDATKQQRSDENAAVNSKRASEAQNAAKPAELNFGAHPCTVTGDYSTSPQSFRSSDASDQTLLVMRVPPLQRHQLITNITTGTVAQRTQDEQHAKEGSVNLVAGDVDASTNEMRGVTNRHTPRSGPLELLPTPTDKAAQGETTALRLPAGETAPDMKEVPYSSTASLGGNPFLEYGEEESEPAFDIDVPFGALPPPQPLSEQPPPLPHHAQYTGVSIIPTSPLSTPTGEAAPTNSTNPIATGGNGASAGNGRVDVPLAPSPLPRQQQHQQQLQEPPHSTAPPVQPPPLPPLSQQRPVASNSTATAKNGDYNTPRGDCAVGGSAHLQQPGQQQQQRRGSQTAGNSATRGPYAASPYTRNDEVARAVDDESPLPLRPPSFDSVPQPESDEVQEAGQVVLMPVGGDEEGFVEHSQLKGQHNEEQQGVNDVGGADNYNNKATNAVALPFDWSNRDMGTCAENDNGVDSNDSFFKGYVDHNARGRRQTRQPHEIGVLTPPVPAAASPSFEQQQQHPPNAQPPPSQPLEASSESLQYFSTAGSEINNRGAANSLFPRRPDEHTDWVDSLHGQRQEQLQSRGQSAQQFAGNATAGASGSAAMQRGQRERSPNGENGTKRFYDGFSQNSTLFLDSRIDSGNTLAQQASPRSAPPPSQTPHQATDPVMPSFLCDTKEHGNLARHNLASSSNPFLGSDEDGVARSNNGVAATELTTTTPAYLLKLQHGITGSYAIPPQQMSPNIFSGVLEPSAVSDNTRPVGNSGQPLSIGSSVNGALGLSLIEEDLGAAGNFNTFLSASGTSGGGAASRTPGGSALVNPFSKAARNAAAASQVDLSSNTAVGGQSPAASLTNSFASRRKPRRLGAPCFAIFVGGATTGLPLGSEMNRGVSCIAACFNNPRPASPNGNGGGAHNSNTGARRVRSPSAQAIQNSGRVSNPSSFRSPPQNSNNGANRSAAATITPRPAGVVNESNNNNNGGSNSSNPTGAGIYISFCSVTEALTAKGSVVDRKGIRGTESGRRYMRALCDAVLPCSLAANEWAANGPKWAEMAEALLAMESCVPAPLTAVVTLILKDAMTEETQEGFVWKDNGGRRLGELLLQAAQAEARKYATTASSNHDDAMLASALNASPLNTSAAGGGTDLEAKEKSAALSKVEDLLCTGQRVEAVEVALDARLYVHALLISMMCPTKDEYLRTVQAVTQKELFLYSPLAHAYRMFNELPLPPLLPPPPPAAAVSSWRNSNHVNNGEDVDEGEEARPTAEHDARRLRELALRDQATLKGTWRRHAAVLLANFTRHSGEGLLALAQSLQQLHLVKESHTCLLMLHLTPLGMAGPVRVGAEPLPPAAELSAEEIEDVLPRPDQRQVMNEIRRRVGVVGGMYHPTQGCRASFLTPVTTLLTQLLHIAHEQLNKRAPPLHVPGLTGPPVPFHGLPCFMPRTDVGYRMMQVLWLREVGLVRESKMALSALLQRMSPPAAFSLSTPPRTLNELVYLFGGVLPPAGGNVPPERLLPSQSLGAESTTPQLANNSTPENIPDTWHPSTTSTSALAALSEKEEQSQQQLDVDEAARGDGRGGSRSAPTSPTNEQTGGSPLLPPPHQQEQHSRPPPQMQPPAQQGGMGCALPPPTPHHQQREQQQTTAPGQRALTLQQCAAVLEPPARTQRQETSASKLPQQLQQQREQEATPASPPEKNSISHSTPKPAAKPAASRRSRSMEALRNLFLRRGKSEADGGEKAPAAEEAKPMHLDTEKMPEFDPVTGRWMFPETEEEKKLRELAKQGPPKIAPRSVTAAAEPAPAAGAPSPSAGCTSGTQRSLPPAVLEGPAGGHAKWPPESPGGHPASMHGAPAPTFTLGRGAPPPMMAGRGGGLRRPGGRQQYVDMFNSTN